MRIGSFNVENLFRRARALNEATWQQTKPVLEDYKRFCEIIAKDTYTAKDKQDLIRTLLKYNLKDRNAAKETYFTLREVRERLFKVPKGQKTPEIVANGRADWDGCLDLKREDVTGEAVENTAQVIAAVNADVLGIVEVEDRIALQLFSDQVLKRYNCAYAHSMVIDGNDERGIDVGIYSRHPIRSICSNIDAGLPGPRIFSRDCAEYEIEAPSGAPLWLLVNHFKSKGYGDKDASDARRKAQAQEVANIYRKRGRNHEYVAVVGDFNDTPKSDALAPLLKDTDLKDAMDHDIYRNKPNARPGTFGSGSASNKIDYVLLSPALWARVRDVDVERHGVWAPKTFPHFETVTGPLTAASDHAAVWVDVAI